ncbi:MAG: hypothetical protein ACT4PL_09870 [Phycisphaerales bacterium]
MVSLLSLVTPILVSALLVFIASNIVWMVLPIHKNDYKRLGDKEDTVLATFRAWGLAPGIWMFPACDPASMKNDPKAAERFKQGPWGNICVMAAPPSMGLCLGMWVVNILLIGLLVGYVASVGLAPGAKYLEVFRLVATVAFLAHAGDALKNSIWKGMPWSHVPGTVIDGLIYAGLTGGTFAWLWPSASSPIPG